MNSNHQNTSGGASIEKTCMFVNRLIEIKKRRSFTINNIGMPHCRFFKKSLNEIQVVLVDAKPYTPLDEIWMKLFHATRLSSLPLQTVFTDLVWTYGRDHSPLLVKKSDSAFSFGVQTSHSLWL